MSSGNFMSAKPIKEFDSVSLLDVEVGPDRWDLYMIAGRDIIYLLGPNSGDEWAHELTEEELQDFPYDIVWSGGETKFEANSKKATELSKCQIFGSLPTCPPLAPSWSCTCTRSIRDSLIRWICPSITNYCVTSDWLTIWLANSL